jgi:hypothetical protein
MAMSDDEDGDDNIIPANVNVEEINEEQENNNTNNGGGIIEFINFLFVVQKPCGCKKDGWSRTSTY